MENKTLENEVMKFKNSSNLKIKMMILVYQFLKFTSGNTYYFLLSLIATLLPIVIVQFSVGTVFFGMIVHYVVFCVLLKNKFEKIFKSKDEVAEIDEILSELKSYLKNKNPK